MNQPPQFPRHLADTDQFYRAVQCVHLKPGGRVSPGAFCNTKNTDKMSVDWAELSTPEETMARFSNWKGQRGIASITASVFWEAEQHIDYDPQKHNEAHTSIVGNDSERLRKRMAKNAKLVHVTST